MDRCSPSAKPKRGTLGGRTRLPGKLLAVDAADRSDHAMLLHITPLETPIVWLAFAAGIALGACATFVLMQRAAKRS